MKKIHRYDKFLTKVRRRSIRDSGFYLTSSILRSFLLLLLVCMYHVSKNPNVSRQSRRHFRKWKKYKDRNLQEKYLISTKNRYDLPKFYSTHLQYFIIFVYMNGIGHILSMKFVFAENSCSQSHIYIFYQNPHSVNRIIAYFLYFLYVFILV